MEPKFIDIKEFIDNGYLQEVNRRFFNILGLNLEVYQDDDGQWAVSGIADWRDDPEGLILHEVFFDHVINVQNELDAKIEARQKAFGWFLQPYEIDADEKQDSPVSE